MIYLDHAATTPMRPEVWEAMSPYAGDVFGNPSGVHTESRRAKNALEEARERVAEILGCEPLEIVFTSGGTESDVLAIRGPAVASGGGVVTVATEHEAVLEPAASLAGPMHGVTVVGVDEEGVVDPAEVGAAVTAGTAVVSVMLANNETGVVQPVREVAAAARAANARVAVHTDAVQAFIAGEVPVEEVDLLTLSAHKLGGPKGVGLLFVREGLSLDPVLPGGGQELGRRSGTQNVMGAVGMSVAMELAASDRPRFLAEVSHARARFESALSDVAQRTVRESLPQHSHLRFPGIDNETLLVRLDMRGVAASAGSACQSGATQTSHVLRAMGMDEAEARECVRVTFGWTSSASEADSAARFVLDALGAE